MGELYPSGEDGSVFPGTERIVVNFDGNVGNAGQSFHCLYYPPAHVEELVFVLPHLASLNAKGTVKAANANDLVEVMRSSTAKYTIVGAKCVGEDFENSVRDALKSLTVMEPHADVDYDIDDECTRTMSTWQRKSHRSRSEAFRERRRWAEDLHAAGIAAMAGLESPPEIDPPTVSLQQKVEGRLGRLEFVTVEEYRKRVGDETATLHLIQYVGGH